MGYRTDPARCGNPVIHVIHPAVMPTIWSVFPLWPSMIAGALLDGWLIQKYMDALPDDGMDILREHARDVEVAFRQLAHAMIAWEATRRGLTAATEASKRADAAHKHALDEAADARIGTVESRARYRNPVYRAKMQVVYEARRRAKKARQSRHSEVAQAKFAVQDLRDIYQRTKRIFEHTLQACYGDSTHDEHAIALARRINVPERRVLTILKRRRSAPLTSQEQGELIALAMAGVPNGLLGTAFYVTMRHVRRMVNTHKKPIEQSQCRLPTYNP